MFSKGSAKYDFMKKVMTPEVTQQEVWDDFMPDRLNEFTMKNGRNVFMLAYVFMVKPEPVKHTPCLD